MKKIFKDKIINIDENLFDNKFLFDYLEVDYKSKNVEVFDMRELLKPKENTELLNNLKWKFAMYSEVFSPKDELEIFEELFEYAISNNKKIHIVWITLREELDILENYYIEQGYLREDVNCFIPDFRNSLVTVSVNIENLIWKGSDYKANREKIFFIPPVRESWQNKAMFKWINRWSIASINIREFKDENILFLENCIKNEKVFSLTLAKILIYNLEEIWLKWNKKELVVSY